MSGCGLENETVAVFAKRTWKEGARHGFHRCCRARFIVSEARPGTLRRLLPGLASRVRGMQLRRQLADGCVPCEYHAAQWLLTGRKQHWRAPLAQGMCCQMRRDLEANNIVHIRSFDLTPEEDDVDDLTRVTMFEIVMPDGMNQGISINACPWCGTQL